MRAAEGNGAFSLEECARLCGGDWAIIIRRFQVSDVALRSKARQRILRTHVLIRGVHCDERPNGCARESTKCQIRQGVGCGSGLAARLSGASVAPAPHEQGCTETDRVE